MHSAEPSVIGTLRRKILDRSTPIATKWRALFALRNIDGSSAETAMTDGKYVSPDLSRNVRQMRCRLLRTSCTKCLNGAAFSDASLPSSAALADASALFRHEVAYCLGQRQEPTALPSLRATLSDSSEHPM